MSCFRFTVALTMMACGTASVAQNTNTGTLVPGRETSTMVTGLSPVPLPQKSETISKAKLNAINEARQTVRRYAECALATLSTDSEHATLVAFLSTPPMTEKASKLAQRLARPNCLPMSGADYVVLKLTDDLVRGGIMRALYLDTKRSSPRYRVLPQELDSGPIGDPTFDMLRRFGACVVGKQAAVVNRFIVSKVGSPEEIALVQGLSPSLNTCLEKGYNVRFSYGVLEAVLAEALFFKPSATASIAVPKGVK